MLAVPADPTYGWPVSRGVKDRASRNSRTNNGWRHQGWCFNTSSGKTRVTYSKAIIRHKPTIILAFLHKTKQSRFPSRNRRSVLMIPQMWQEFTLQHYHTKHDSNNNLQKAFDRFNRVHSAISRERNNTVYRVGSNLIVIMIKWLNLIRLNNLI